MIKQEWMASNKLFTDHGMVVEWKLTSWWLFSLNDTWESRVFNAINMQTTSVPFTSTLLSPEEYIHLKGICLERPVTWNVLQPCKNIYRPEKLIVIRIMLKRKCSNTFLHQMHLSVNMPSTFEGNISWSCAWQSRVIERIWWL